MRLMLERTRCTRYLFFPVARVFPAPLIVPVANDNSKTLSNCIPRNDKLLASSVRRPSLYVSVKNLSNLIASAKTKKKRGRRKKRGMPASTKRVVAYAIRTHTHTSVQILLESWNVTVLIVLSRGW